MKIIGEEKKYEGKFIEVVGQRIVTKTGEEYVWETVRRRNVSGIIAVFAVTPEKELVMVKQFRVPLNSRVVELPAGLADKAVESLEACAKRELQEETGYRADKITYIHGGPFNSGMCNDELDIFYAPDVVYVGHDEHHQPDDVEEIEVLKVPLKDLVDFCLKNDEKYKIDIKILGTLKVLEYRGYL